MTESGPATGPFPGGNPRADRPLTLTAEPDQGRRQATAAHRRVHRPDGIRGDFPRLGVFSKSPESSGGDANACHPGQQSPSTANAPSGDHSPETHPNHGAEPDHLQRRSTRDSSRPTVVEGRPSGVVVEGAEAQPTPLMGPTSQYGTQFLYKKKRETGTAGTPSRIREETEKNGKKRTGRTGRSQFRATPS